MTDAARAHASIPVAVCCPDSRASWLPPLHFKPSVKVAYNPVSGLPAENTFTARRLATWLFCTPLVRTCPVCPASRLPQMGPQVLRAVSRLAACGRVAKKDWKPPDAVSARQEVNFFFYCRAKKWGGLVQTFRKNVQTFRNYFRCTLHYQAAPWWRIQKKWGGHQQMSQKRYHPAGNTLFVL